MNKEIKVKINNYLKTRGLFFFTLFFIINLLAYLNINNLFIDILSHFRLQYLLVCTMFLVMFVYLTFEDKKFIFTGLVCLLLTAVNGFGIRSYIGAADFTQEGESIKIGLFNVLTQNTNYEKLLEQIQIRTPDIIILQEVDETWLDNIKQLKSDYPYIKELSRYDNFGIALYSKLPLKSAKIEYWTDAEVPVIHAVYADDIEIYGIHTLPPVSKKYFETRNEMLKKINELALKQKIIICGDLNTTIYSPAYRNFISSTNLNDAQIKAKNIYGTWNSRHFPIFRIPLEHILFSENLYLKSFSIGEDFGSDHLPIFTEIGW